MRVKALTIAAAAIVLALAPAAPAFAQQDEATSPALVKQLVSALKARHLDAIAAVDPDDPGRVVAALVFPDVQMLVMSSRHKSAEYLKGQIAKGQFMAVYEELQMGVADGRVFIHDLGCDGLANGGDNIDIYYEGAQDKTLLDGNWMGQSLTEDTYAAKRKDAEAKYSHALSVLLAAARKLPSKT